MKDYLNSWFNSDLRTDTDRIKTETGVTSFDLGRQFRISAPLEIVASTPFVIKFVSPVDFDIRLQSLECDNEAILFQAYRSTQGTESGTFDTSIPVYSNNFKSTVPSYTMQATLTTGGAFTPSVGQTSVETIRVKTSGSTAHATTVGGAFGGIRGLSAGTYYLKLSNFQNGTAEGVFSLIFDEIP